MTDQKLMSIGDQIDRVLKKGPITSQIASFDSAAQREGGEADGNPNIVAGNENKQTISKQLRKVKDKQRRQMANQLITTSPILNKSKSMKKFEEPKSPLAVQIVSQMEFKNEQVNEEPFIIPTSFEKELEIEGKAGLPETSEDEHQIVVYKVQDENNLNYYREEKEMVNAALDPVIEHYHSEKIIDDAPIAPSQPTDQNEGGMEQEEPGQNKNSSGNSGDMKNIDTAFVSKQGSESQLNIKVISMKDKKQKSGKNENSRQPEFVVESLLDFSENQDQVFQLKKSKNKSELKLNESSFRSQKSNVSKKSKSSRKVKIQEEEEQETSQQISGKVSFIQESMEEHVHQNDEAMAEDKTLYYNMTIQHSIAINDEHKFDQFMKKIGFQFQMDRNDKLALSILENYQNSNFMEIKKMVQLKEIRQYYNLALKYCIKKKRDVIAFDLINFSQEMFFHLMIDQKDLTLLIQNKLYVVIEKLVFSHCEYKFESNNDQNNQYKSKTKQDGVDLEKINDTQAQKGIARQIIRLTNESFSQISDDEIQKEGGDGQKSESSQILRQKLDSLPEQRIDIQSRVGTEAPGMREYRSGSKKKLKKDPGRFLMKKMKAEGELIGIGNTNANEPIQGNILDNQLLDSELNNPFSEGGTVVLESPMRQLGMKKKTTMEQQPERNSSELGSIQQTIKDSPAAGFKKKYIQTELETEMTQVNKGQQIINDGSVIIMQDQEEMGFENQRYINDQPVNSEQAVKYLETPIQEQQRAGEKPAQNHQSNKQSMDSAAITDRVIQNVYASRRNSLAEYGTPEYKPVIEITNEKYIEISDFITYILQFPDLFMNLENFQNASQEIVDQPDISEMMKQLQETILEKVESSNVPEFINKFLLQVQDCVNYEQVISIFIYTNNCHRIMDELFEQTDASIRSSDSNEYLITEKDDDKNLGPLGYTITLSKEIFGRTNRLKLLIGLINNSIGDKMYEIAYEVTKRFMSDLLKAKHLPIFDQLFNQFAEDTTRYEAKLAIMLNCMPLMNRQIAARFMKTMENIVAEPASNSILKKNINPMRVGLILYRVLDEVQKEYAYSPHSTQILKETLAELIRSTLEIYNDPDELMLLVEQIDYEGHDCFWYLDEYNLYSLLDSRMMDRVISKKWQGMFDVNASMMDYSTANLLYNDKFKLYATDRLFSELRIEILNFDMSDRTHYFKFHVWQHSMKLRFEIDLTITFIFLLMFQWFLVQYGSALISVKKYALKNNIIGNDAIANDLLGIDENNKDVYIEFLGMLDLCGNQLYYVMIVSFAQLILPISEAWSLFFVFKTKRKSSEYGVDKINELILFIVVVLWTLIRTNWEKYDENIMFAKAENTAQQQYVGAILYNTVQNNLFFTVLLATLACNSWLKFLLRMSKTKTFGPQFKMIIVMFEELLQFMIFFILMLMMFTCIASLLYGNDTVYFKQSFTDILYSYYQTSLGSWSNSTYDSLDIHGNPITIFTYMGVFYNILFLFTFNVLLLNYVIAVLSSTFANYQTKQLGLYYEVIVASFPSMDYDDRYGSIVCAVSPLNLLIFPFQWLQIFLEGDKLIMYNTWMCHLLYLPISIGCVTYFSIKNILLVPVAYVAHFFALVETVTDSDETMDELSEKLERIYTIIKFAIFGFPFLMGASFLDIFKFWKNLYSKPYDAESQIDKQVLSEQTIKMFVESCKEIMKEEQSKHFKDEDFSKGSVPTTVDFVKINKRLQQKLEIQKQISVLIFDYSGDKFIHDEHTKSSQINKKYLKGIKEYAVIKQLVCNAADKVGKVDVNLLLGLVEQVQLRYKMLQIEIKSGDLEIDSNNEEIMRDILYELAKTEPSMVEAQLGDESQVMDVIDDKLEDIKKNFVKFENVINCRFDKTQVLIMKLVELQIMNRKSELKHQRTLSKDRNLRKTLKAERKAQAVL